MKAFHSHYVQLHTCVRPHLNLLVCAIPVGFPTFPTLLKLNQQVRNNSKATTVHIREDQPPSARTNVSLFPGSVASLSTTSSWVALGAGGRLQREVPSKMPAFTSPWPRFGTAFPHSGEEPNSSTRDHLDETVTPSQSVNETPQNQFP